MSDITSTDIDVISDETASGSPTNVVRDAIERLQSGNAGVYSSVIGDDFDTRLRVLSAVQSAEALVDVVNQPFTLKDVVIQEIEMANQQTGEMAPAARVILLTDDGRALYAISKGVLSAVINFVGVLGQPHTWPAEGVKVVMNKEKAKQGNVFVLRPYFGSPKK